MKRVICVICGAEVTKRQSLAYKEGRACRIHSEVQDMKEQQHLDWKNEHLDWMLRKIFLVCQIRWLHTSRLMMAKKVYRKLERIISPERVQELRNEVNGLGGPQMTDEEVGNAFFDAFTLKKMEKDLLDESEEV